ncbi:MAG: nitroreductase family protein [Anaerolineae bacterium]|nr:nitroreductase family protein [Anaerolineae bacterium]
MSPDMPHPDQVFELLSTRRSIRKYLPDPVREPLLRRLLEAATWAPSAHNRQPWRFVVIREPEARSSLIEAMEARLIADLRVDQAPEEIILREATHSRRRLTMSPALILVGLSMADMDVYPDPARQSHEHTMAVQSTAMAAQSLMLMAHAEGLATCWLCPPLFCADTVRAALGLPENFEAQCVIALGYPAEERAKTRRRFDEVTLYR